MIPEASVFSLRGCLSWLALCTPQNSDKLSDMGFLSKNLFVGRKNSQFFLQKHWTWIEWKVDHFLRKHIQSISPCGVSPLGWKQNLPLMFVKFETTPCSNFYLPTRRDPVFSRFSLMTEQGLPSLDELWSTWTRLNGSNPKIPIYQIDDFWIFLIFPSFHVFQMWIPSIPASNSNTMP